LIEAGPYSCHTVILREPACALHPRARTLWAVEGLIASGALLAAVVAGFTVAILSGWDDRLAWLLFGAAVVLVLAVGVLLVVVGPAIRFDHYRYEVTELGLYVAQGKLWRSWQVVPHARVQTVDTNAGPLHRAFGLVSAKVTTASAAGGTEIPGLDPKVADALVDELARRAGIEEGT
jgi:uncharacterized protein